MFGSGWMKSRTGFHLDTEIDPLNALLSIRLFRARGGTG